MTISITLIAPAGVVSTNVTGISGASYGVDANGFVTITAAGDVALFLNAGYRFAAPSIASQQVGANGLTAANLRLLDMATPTGGPLAAAASAGLFGYSITPATQFALVTEAANNNAKSDSGLLEYIVPAGYVAGSNLTVTMNASVNIGSGTLSVKTLGLAAYRCSTAGVEGVNICSTSVQTLTSNAATDYTFTITGATLFPGDRLVLQPTLAITETSSHAVTANLNSVRVS